MKKVKIGSVIKAKEKGQTYYIRLAPGVSISVNGKPVKAEYVNLSDPHKLPDILESMGKVSPEVASEMREKAKKIPFVRFDLLVSTGE